MHFFASSGPDKIWLARQQAFRRRQADKILRRFDLLLEVIVFRLDVRRRLDWRVRRAVSDEGRVGGAHAIDQEIYRLIERLLALQRNGENEKSEDRP